MKFFQKNLNKGSDNEDCGLESWQFSEYITIPNERDKKISELFDEVIMRLDRIEQKIQKLNENNG